MTTQVASYIVASYRHVRGLPDWGESDWSPSGHLDVGPLGIAYPHTFHRAVRVLSLRLVASEAKWALLYFFEPSEFDRLFEAGPGRDTICGNIYLHGDPKYMVVWLPLSDFADTYHLLQTEKPVWADWVFWSTPTETTIAIAGFALRTGTEVLGEGLADDIFPRTLTHPKPVPPPVG
jgi:hypothetical protein